MTFVAIVSAGVIAFIAGVAVAVAAGVAATVVACIIGVAVVLHHRVILVHRRDTIVVRGGSVGWALAVVLAGSVLMVHATDCSDAP